MSARRCRPPTSTRRHRQAGGGVGGGSRRPYPFFAPLRRPDPSHSHRHRRRAVAPRLATPTPPSLSPPSLSCCWQALGNGQVRKSVTARAAPTGRVSQPTLNPTGQPPVLRALSLVWHPQPHRVTGVPAVVTVAATSAPPRQVEGPPSPPLRRPSARERSGRRARHTRQPRRCIAGAIAAVTTAATHTATIDNLLKG